MRFYFGARYRFTCIVAPHIRGKLRVKRKQGEVYGYVLTLTTSKNLPLTVTFTKIDRWNIYKTYFASAKAVQKKFPLTAIEQWVFSVTKPLETIAVLREVESFLEESKIS